MRDLEEEEEAAEEEGKAEDVLLPEMDRVFEVSTEEEAVQEQVNENKRSLNDKEELRPSQPKHKRNEKPHAETNTVINKEEWKPDKKDWS